MLRLPKKADQPQTPATDSTLKGRRIFFVLFNLELGGAERQALILAKHLVGHEEAVVEVFGFNKTGPVADMCEELGVPWHLDSFRLESTRNGRFAGQVLDVPGLLSAVDVGVFSSNIEGCPNGVLESLAAGLAVAGTDIDATRSAVGPKGLQFLAPPKDDEALAAAILKLANDSDLRVTVGTENQRRVRERFTAPRMCESTVAVIKEVLSNVP